MSLSKISKLLVDRKDLPQQYKRYKQTVLWIYREVFRNRPGASILALVTNFVGPVLMGSAMGFLIYFANKLESNKALSYSLGSLQLSLQPRDPMDFGIVVLLIGLMMLCSGIILFCGNYITIRLAVRFALDKSQSVLTIQGGRPWRNHNPSAGPYPKEVQQCAQGVLPLVRAIRPLLQLFRPLFLLLFSLAALLYFNILLTIIVGLVALPSLIFQYRINYTAAKNEELLARSRRKMQKSITNLLDSVANAPRPGSSKSMSRFLEQTYSQESIRELPERFIMRVLAGNKSQAVSSILIAILSVIIISHLGISALNGHIAWSLMLGYIVFARIAMNSLRNLLGIITGFARHYPKALKIYILLTTWPGKKNLGVDIIKFRCKKLEDPGDISSGKLHRGDILGALSPVPLTRFNTFAWAEALGSITNIGKQRIWGSMICIPNALGSTPCETLRELLDLSSALSADEVRKAAQLLGEVDLSQINVDALTDEGTWKTLPNAFRCHALLDLGARERGDTILVEHEVLKGAQEWFLKSWWTKVANRFIILRYSDPSEIGSWGEKKALAMRKDRVTALMSIEWAMQNMDLLNAWFAKAHSLDTEEEDDLDYDDD